MSSKKTIQHFDIFDKEITVGSFVAASWNNCDLKVCEVIKVNPKMIKVKRLEIGDKKFYRNEKNKYPHELVLVDKDDVVMYILRNSK